MRTGSRSVGTPGRVLLAILAVCALAPTAGAQTASGAPRPSDVVFSSRFMRAGSAKVAEQFGATRVEWVYLRSEQAMQELPRFRIPVGFALSAVPDLPAGEGYSRDFDGNPLVVPWLKAAGTRWASTTHPETLGVQQAQLDRYLVLGAAAIHFDDPQLQAFPAANQGGDFNDATVAGFPDWLRRHPDRARVRAAGLDGFDGNYRDFLRRVHGVKDAADYGRRLKGLPTTALWLDYVRDTVDRYFEGMRSRVQARAGRTIPFSMNLTGLVWPDVQQPTYFLAAHAQYTMAETPVRDVEDLIARAATMRALGLGYVPSIQPAGVATDRVAIAALYALGANPLVPWDVFVPDAPRYFGTVADYGDLYGFVRREAARFDDQVLQAEVGIVVDPRNFPREAVKAYAHRLNERGIGYDFILVGPEAAGREAARSERLAGLRLLVSAVPDAQLAAPDRALLTRTGLPLRRLDEPGDGVLDALRPLLVAPGGERLRVIVRRHAINAGRWMVHLVDESRGAPDQAAGPEGCSRRLVWRNRPPAAVPALAARWVTPKGTVEVKGERSPQGDVGYTLPGCPLWGLLEVSAGS